MRQSGMWMAALVVLMGLGLLAGPVRADDPKVIKVTAPGGTVTMDPSGVEVKTPGANIEVSPGKVIMNTPEGVGVAADADAEGALRYNCAGNRTVIVTGKVLTAADGVVFKASGNCTLKLKDVVVSGYGIIDARGNATVEVQDCTFTSSSLAVLAAGSAEVTLRDCVITAAETAIDARGNAEVNLKNVTTMGRMIKADNAEINVR